MSALAAVLHVVRVGSAWLHVCNLFTLLLLRDSHLSQFCCKRCVQFQDCTTAEMAQQLLPQCTCNSSTLQIRRPFSAPPSSSAKAQRHERSTAVCAAVSSPIPRHDMPCTTRRGFLLSSAAAVLLAQSSPACAATDVPPARIDLSRTPDQSRYDPTDSELRAAANLLQKALNAVTVEQEEALWTELIDTYRGVKADWVPDIVGRALGNRGNARTRQGRLNAALGDFNAAIELCPWAVDPVLNRGVCLEGMARWEEAIADYKAVLAAAPNDPSAWNNLGNPNAALGNWEVAEQCFGKAASLAPEFAFASGNQALALYQLGQTDRAVRQMRQLLRRYQDFDDMRAALALALWDIGKREEAETQWSRVDDIRYKDAAWLKSQRHWPPRLLNDLEAFKGIRAV